VASNKRVVIVEQWRKHFWQFLSPLVGSLIILTVEGKNLEGAEGTRRMSDQFLPILNPLDGTLGHPFNC
jgi:hypothetical protein